MVSSSEQQQQERFHKIRHMFNIDGLLSQYGRGIEERPHVDKLIEIVFAASHGDFSLYEQFIEELRGGVQKS